MTSQLKLLIVSNPTDDVTNFLSILQEGSYTPSIYQVDNFQDFQALLETDDWDLIICDQYLPNFGVDTVWQFLQSSRVEIPFLVLGNAVGTDQEEVAIAWLRRGITDYIDRQHPRRLLQVLARELTGRKIRKEKIPQEIQSLREQVQQELKNRLQVEAILQESEERFYLMGQVTNDAIWDWRKDSEYLWWGNSFHTLFGYDLQSIVPTWELWVSLIHPEDCPRVLNLTQEILESTNPEITSRAIEYRFQRWDGSYAYVLNRFYAICNAQGEVERLIGSMMDLSDRHSIEETLRTNQERYELAVCAGNVGVWDWNLERSEFYIDSNLKNTLGYTDLDIPNSLEAWYGLICLEDRGLVMAAIQDYLEGLTSTYAVEHRKVCKDGTILWFFSQGVAFSGANDQIIRMAGTETEITARKQAEAALLEKALLLDLANDCIIVRDLEDQITFWNQKAVEVYGYTAKEAIGQPLYDLLPIAFPQRLQAIKTQLLNHGRWEGELMQTKRDGTEIIVSSRQSLQRDGLDHPRQILDINTDITDAKQARVSLQEANRRWRSLLDNIQMVVMGMDKNGVLEYVNSFFLELTGYATTEEVLGQRLENLIPSAHYQGVKDHTFAGAKDFTTHYENPILTKAGEERIIAWNNTLLHDIHGNVIGTMSIGEDITDRQIINRMKDEFISVISHELRTPLTAIRGSLGLLSSGFLEKYPEKAQRMIAIAAENTDRLTRLINDVLDLERIESGKMDLQVSICSPLEMIQYTFTTLQPLAIKNNIILKLGEITPAAANLALLADRDRLLQVLTNLVGNAIKFSPPHGIIQVTAVLISCNDKTLENTSTKNKLCSLHPEDSKNHILFQIKDQGLGIPPEKLETIFDRFQQIDASDSRRKGGTGLGLAICRNIIRQHRGEIWAESQPGEGSTFLFSLPFVASDSPISATSSPVGPKVLPNLGLIPQTHPYRALVVEDDPDLAKVLLATLEYQGLEAFHAPTGKAAIQMSQELSPDLLLLDLVLPEGNGFVVVDWLRLSRFWAQIPLIIYSALELTPEERQKVSLGPTEYFIKGKINPEELVRRSIALLNQQDIEMLTVLKER